MSRISAYGAAVSSTTVTAVVALCLAGGFTAREQSGPLTTTLVAASTDANASTSVVSAIDANLATGSRGGAFFGAGDGVAKSLETTGDPASSALSATQPNPGAVALLIAPILSVPATSTSSQFSAALPAAQPAVAAVVAAATPVTAVLPAAVVPATPRQAAESLAAARGWTQQQWVCLDDLWQRESNFRPTVANRWSGAYGIPQALPASKMASAGSDWRSNPVTQIQWGLGYIAARYGSPCNAWSHWRRHRSY